MNKSIRYNKSKTYLLPLISEFISFDYRYFKFLENTYLFDNLNMYNNCIYFEYNFSKIKVNSEKFENNMIDNNYFIDLLKITDKHKIFIFRIPEEYKTEYQYFKLGKYSKYSIPAKHIILDFYTNIYSGNINAIDFLMKLKQVLFKDNKLKQKIEEELNVRLSSDAELTDIMNKKNETLNIEKIIKQQVSIYSDNENE